MKYFQVFNFFSLFSVSPLCLPQSSVARKSSVISIDDFVEDAAKQFDQLTDGSDFSLDSDCDTTNRNDKLK